MIKNFLFVFTVFFVFISCQDPVLVIPSKSDNSYLSEITIDGVPLENFSTSQYNYKIKTTKKEVTVDAKKVSANSTVTGLGIKNLILGGNLITLSVYSESEKNATFYYLNIYCYDDSSAYIYDLKINGESVSNFSYDKTTFNCDLQNNSKINIEPLPVNSDATVNGAGLVILDLSSDTIPVNFTVTSKDTTQTKTYTIIFNRNADFSGFYNVTDLSYEFQKDGYKTVIFGDSLSVGYGFFDGASHEEAKDIYPGILSWSHMIRDAIIRSDPYFTHADQLMIGASTSTISVTKSYSGNGAESPEVNYWMPLNNRNIVVTGITKSDEIVVFRYSVKNHITKKAVLYFSKTPNSVGCSFDIYVDNVLKISEFDTASHDDKYFNGFEMVTVELNGLAIGDHEIKLTNFKNTTTLVTPAASMGFFMLGIGSKNSPTYLTGRSGVSTEFYVRDNYKELKSRVLDYKPDLAIFIIGANDSSNSGAEPSGLVSIGDYYTNLSNIVRKIKEVSKYCNILLISPPLWEGIDKSHIMAYGEKMKLVAGFEKCQYLDTIELLKNFPAQNEVVAKWRDWRTDAIHFTHYGNTIMARSILNKLAPYSPFQREFVDADMVFTSTNNMFIPEHGWMIVKYNILTKNFDPAQYDWNYGRNFIRYVKKDPGSSIMEIGTFPTGTPGMPKLTVEQFGSNVYEYYTRSETFWNDYQRFWILKRGYQSDGTNIPYAISDDDYKNQALNLKFVISW